MKDNTKKKDNTVKSRASLLKENEILVREIKLILESHENMSDELIEHHNKITMLRHGNLTLREKLDLIKKHNPNIVERSRDAEALDNNAKGGMDGGSSSTSDKNEPKLGKGDPANFSNIINKLNSEVAELTAMNKSWDITCSKLSVELTEARENPSEEFNFSLNICWGLFKIMW